LSHFEPPIFFVVYELDLSTLKKHLPIYIRNSRDCKSEILDLENFTTCGEFEEKLGRPDGRFPYYFCNSRTITSKTTGQLPAVFLQNLAMDRFPFAYTLRQSKVEPSNRYLKSSTLKLR